MTEAVKAVMEFLFDEVGYHRVEAMHDPNNPNSGKVMKKCGMKYEGTLRQADRNNQGVCDACYYCAPCAGTKVRKNPLCFWHNGFFNLRGQIFCPASGRELRR